MPVTLRTAQPADAAGLLAIYAPVVMDTGISFELVPPTTAEFAARIEQIGRQYPWLVCREDGDTLGYAYATSFRDRPAYRWAAELAVYVAEGHRRRRVAHSLYHALLGCLRLQGHHLAVAGIALPNPHSVAFHEALGFRPIGVVKEVGNKFGKWRDVGFWDQVIQDIPATAPEPTPYPLLPVDGRDRVLEEAAGLVN